MGKILIITAAASDYLYQCLGTVLKYKSENAEIHVVALTNQKHEDIAAIQGISEKIGVSYECWDYPAPFQKDKENLERIAKAMRSIRPDFILTHHKEEAGEKIENRVLTAQAVMAAYTIASAWGANLDDLPTAPRQTPMFGFVPKGIESGLYNPDFYINVTDYYADKKAIMATMSPSSLCSTIADDRMNGSCCAYFSCNADCVYAEAFSKYGPVYSYDAFVW